MTERSSDTAAQDQRRILLATDGSDLANDALVTGLRLVGTPASVLVITVVPAADPSLAVGSGHAGPVMSVSEKQDLLDAREAQATAVLADTVELLAPQTAGVRVETAILSGDAGDEICRAAEVQGVSGIVLGTRGQGGLRRALLGSVSDRVVRNAPCPVVTVNPS